MSRSGALVAALLATLVRPSWWLIALAGLLVRGGFVAIVLPIVAIPSALAISNVVAPLIVPVVFGRFDEVAGLAALAALVLGAWLIGGGWVAALADIALVREAAVVAVEDGVTDGGRGPLGAAARGFGRLAVRVMAVRLGAHVPLAIALALGAIRVVDVLYLELTRPFEVVTPLFVRVVAGAAVPLLVILVAWLVSDAWAARAIRRAILADRPARAALAESGRELLARPLPILAGELVTTLPFVLVGGLALGATALAWSQVTVVLLAIPIDRIVLAIALMAFLGAWVVALAAAGFLAAWRAVATTWEVLREARPGRPGALDGPVGGGTFGASGDGRPGDWSVGGEGGSL